MLSTTAPWLMQLISDSSNRLASRCPPPIEPRIVTSYSAPRSTSDLETPHRPRQTTGNTALTTLVWARERGLTFRHG